LRDAKPMAAATFLLSDPLGQKDYWSGTIRIAGSST
jgi:hypothetical protein